MTANRGATVLHYESAGIGPQAMVLLPPNPMDWTAWLFQLAHFSTWYRTIAVDLHGYGRSPGPPRGTTIEEMASDVWRTVEDLTDEPLVLVGNSVGAEVALFMAAERPAATGALVISGYGYSLEKTFVPKRIAHYRQVGVAGRRDHVIEGFGGQARGEAFAQYVADVTAERDGWTDVEDIVTIFEACARPEPESVYQGVTSPSIIVTGTEDSAHRSSLALHERLAGSELAKMEGAGHLCQLERPWEWDGIVLDFLRRHRLLPAAMKENRNGRG